MIPVSPCAACRVVGPVNESAINPLCGRPYGGPLLKWDWASSSFLPVPDITAAGFRLTVMPETHMPWVVDGCGQLRGWSASLKSVYGPAPASTLRTYYDIAAVNGTGTEPRLFCMLSCVALLRWMPPRLPHAVYSGCASFNPSTLTGNIAQACTLSVSVGPDKRLRTFATGDVAVTAAGQELVTAAASQQLRYLDAKLSR